VGQDPTGTPALAGTVAIVTGASSGIGAATAQGLAAQGARVIINYASNALGAERVAQACRDAGGDAETVQADVANEADCGRIVAAAAKWGRLDVLINNAGVTVHAGSSTLDGVSAETFMRIVAVNLLGPFQMCRLAKPLLVEGARLAGAPRAVVNVTSFSAFNGSGSSMPYAASKAGLENLTLSLARALAPFARVNAVMPGYVDTDWFEKGASRTARMQMVEQVRACSPLAAVTTADEVADAILMLCSPGARHVTGRSLLVDAGAHLATAFSVSNAKDIA